MPIAKLPFPKVTVCPPKGTNTALNYDIFKANETFTEEEKEKLLNATFDIFLLPELEKARLLSNLYNDENLQDCYNGIQKISLPYNGKFRFESTATSGSFTPNLSFMHNSSRDWEFEYMVMLSDLENSDNKTIIVEIETNFKVTMMISGVELTREDHDYNFTIKQTKVDLKIGLEFRNNL